MRPMRVFSGLLGAALLLAAPLFAQPKPAAPKWKLQYFYDQEKTSLTINDFAFPSAQYGIAVGYIAEGKHEEPTQLLSADGGEHWTLSPLKEMPIALFFLNDQLGWMVTSKGLWRTSEAGRNWVKLPKPPGDLLRVCFTSEKDGYAVGIKKLVLQTHDGGETWKKVKEAEDQPGDAQYSAYVWVAFADPKIGLITGANIPPRRFAPYYPDWLDPAATLRMRDIPHLSYSLVTLDGGETWRTKSASLLGQTSRFQLNLNGKGLGLIEYSELSEIPSEVYVIDWHKNTASIVFKEKSIGITDIKMENDGTAYICGVQEAGRLRDIIPSKVVVLRSRDYTHWEKMPVDYRASAIRTLFAAPDAAHRFIATDNGMILKWTGD
jgi:hypothetical protein